MFQAAHCNQSSDYNSGKVESHILLRCYVVRKHPKLHILLTAIAWLSDSSVHHANRTRTTLPLQLVNYYSVEQARCSETWMVLT